MKTCSVFVFSLLSLVFAAQLAPAQVPNGVEIGDGLTASVFNAREAAGKKAERAILAGSPLRPTSVCNPKQSDEVRAMDADGKTVFSVPIDPCAGVYEYSRSADTLYVLHNGKKQEHFISAVNLKTRQVDRKIKVGAGGWYRLLAFDDADRLYCLAYSKNGTSLREDYVGVGSLKNQYAPTITVIDTKTNEVVTSYRWLDQFKGSLKKHAGNALLGFHLLSPGSTKTISVLSIAFFRHPLLQTVYTFSEDSTAPISAVDVEGTVAGSLCSNDGRYLFVALEGEKDKHGMLEVIDLQSKTNATRELGFVPTRLFRLGSQKELWVLGKEEMQSVSESGELNEDRIVLGKVAKTSGDNDPDASALIDGYPGETITVGKEYAAMQINSKHGQSKHRVALINLKQMRVEAVIPTMSAAELAGLKTERWGAAIALAALGAASGARMYPVFIPTGIRNEAMAAQPDGQLLFVLDREASEVTAINVSDASVLKRFKVPNDSAKIKVAEDGKHLLCFGRTAHQIDLAANGVAE